MPDSAPKKLTAQQIIDRVDRLEKDQEMAGMRTAIEERHKLHNMQRLPSLFESVTEGKQFSTPTPDVFDVIQTVCSDQRSYPTTVACIPDDPKAQHTADEAEKWFATQLARLDDGYRASWSGTWDQEASAAAVFILNRGPVAQGAKRWSVDCPLITTCFFPDDEYPKRPSEMGRRYTQTVREAKRTYHDQKPGKVRGEANEYAGRRLLYDDKGVPVYELMSSDQNADEAAAIENGGKDDDVKQVTFYWYSDADYTYHVAASGFEGAQGKSEEAGIVFCHRNGPRGVPAVVFPGALTHQRGRYHMLPAQWSAMQCSVVIELLLAWIGHYAANIDGALVVEDNPENLDFLLKLQESGAIAAGGDVGGRMVIHTGGARAWTWQQPPNEYLKTLLEFWTNKQQQLIATALSVTSAKTQEQGTAQGIAMAIGVRKRVQGPRIGYRDYAWAELLEEVRSDVIDADQDFDTSARGGERYGKGELKASAGVKMNKALAQGKYTITVTTEAITDEERRQLSLWVMQLVAAGWATPREMLEALGAPDPAAQAKSLAEMDAERVAAQTWNHLIAIAAQEEMLLDGGIMLEALQPPVQQPQAVGAGGGSNGTHAPQETVIQGPAGGSMPPGMGA